MSFPWRHYDERMSNVIPPVRRSLLSSALLRSLVTALLLAVVLSAAPASASPMSTLESDLAQEFLGQLNAERGARGLAPLIVDSAITPDAAAWAASLVASQSLDHSGLPRAEIIGRGGRTGQITEAWMLSSGHRNLVVDANLGYAGVGVACDNAGQMWVVVQFRRIDTRLGTLTSSANSPVVTPKSNGGTCAQAPVSATTVNSIKRLYSAYFLRDADQQGLEYWKGQAGRGVDMPDVSESFAASSEFGARYGQLSSKNFVALVYTNVMGRSADKSGYDYWLRKLSSGMSRGEMMTNFSESTEYRIRTGLS